MPNITYYNITLPTPFFRDSFIIYSYLVQVVNFLLFVLTSIILLYCSPKSIGAYKFYMLWSVTNIYLSILLIALDDMEHLTPYGVFIARGMPKAADSPFLAVIFQMLSYSLLEVNILITMCKFLFRYTVATNQEKMTKLLSHKLCFALLLSVLVFCFGTSWVTNRNSTDDAQEYKDSFPIFDTALREYINDNIIVLTKSNALDWIIQHIVFPLVLIFSAYCTYSCYKFRNTNTAFSERTRHFFYVLTKGLVIEQLSLVLWVLLPLVLIEIAIPLRQKVIASYVFIRILYLYPAFVMAFTLTYYKRYRRAVLYLFNHSNKKNVTTLSSVASSSLVVKNRPTFSKNSLSATLPSRNAVSAQGRRVL